MLDLRICPACGDRAERPIATGETLVCGRCGHRWPFRRLPLFALTGPSGAGKSTVGPALAARMSGDVVVLEQDVLWTGALRDDVPGHPAFRAAWLRMAAMLHQNGRPVVLCGTVAPPELEPLPERVFFAEVHYLALVADPAALRRRLRARPAWREWDEERIDEMLGFNAWIRGQADHFDTTEVPLDETVAHVEKWVRAGLKQPAAT
ncbi:AAA family ATPase [Amycolatopsis saalfeldensis]|uniref:Broad-specificity NMP kinase n=1 Tax=Amycolatopsis saalfeldensis TaxID=394193 RepID=A0A1H8XMQ6_9PSEU|nr:AAA family ATPase [Amycolatopsis saalfeldensis]SEP41061.1 Broad-specificity NMP kinase [Amycolatopsis saalfeldensis]